MTRFGYTFPAIRGIQAKQEYFISMCPLRLIPKVFLYDECEIPPELRAQRTLNKQRIPEIARYILGNRKNYVFSAITASIDAEVEFTPIGTKGDAKKIGELKVPMDAKFIINDGQHRRAAIEHALRENPEIGDESIAVVFFLDIGLSRCQQMFADLNRHAIRPSKSLGVLYDHRDNLSKICRLLIMKSEFFKDIVEMERSTLAKRSRKLFTLSAFYNGTSELLRTFDLNETTECAKIAQDFWEEVAKNLPEWKMVRNRKMVAGEVRQDFIHSHGIVIHSLGLVGHFLLNNHKKDWKKKLQGLYEIDWSRNNSKLWEGRALIGGRVSKSVQNVKLTTNAIKNAIGLSLLPDEQKAEKAFKRKLQ
jgi:DNA sulfur modification protein DndB